MINNFLINRILTITGFDKDDNILYRLTQPQNVSLTTSSETAEVVDSLGTPIAVFDRSKSAELSGENAIFDMKLLAEQHGTDVELTADEVPAFEEKKNLGGLIFLVLGFVGMAAGIVLMVLQMFMKTRYAEYISIMPKTN